MQSADRRAAQIVLVANAALELVRVVGHATAAGAGPLPRPVRAAFHHLAAAAAALARPEASALSQAAASAAAAAEHAAALDMDRPASLAGLAALLIGDCAAGIRQLAGPVKPGEPAHQDQGNRQRHHHARVDPQLDHRGRQRQPPAHQRQLGPDGEDVPATVASWREWTWPCSPTV